MKRKIKNIIMLVLVVVLLGSLYFTINNFKGGNINKDMANSTPPDMPSGENNMGEQPEKPEENNSTEEKEDKTDDNKTEEKSDENNTDDNSKGNMEEPPAKPDGEDNNSSENNGMPDMSGNQMNNQEMNNKLSIKNYIIFGVQNLILTSLIVYLIMSKFNKKTFKETLVNGDKIMIALLLIIILTAGLTYLDSYIINHKSNSKNNEPEKMENTNTSVTYSAANEIKENKEENDKDYSSTTEDENALLVSGKIDVTLSNITAEKTGDSSAGDNTSFYGINSAIIAKDGSNLTLKNITVNTDATGANGVFCYGGSATTNNSSSDGTTVTISDSTITTKKDNSGGIMTTGGGTMNATNLTVTTSGISSAAIRSDRGGGEVNVNKGTYKTTGKGSPTIYSTANITVKNATLEATTSEGVVIEGKNSVSLENVDLTDTNSELNGQSTTYKNIFLYQSMSGDAADGNSEFSATNSNITTNKGDTFYITNTTAIITLENNTFVNNDESGNFLRAQADSWGNSGSNGGDVTLTLSNQNVSGNIKIDSISTLDMTMKSNSYYEGNINSDNKAKKITLTLDKTSKIKLTGDTYITTLNNKDTSNSNIDFNGYKLYVNNKAIN